MNPVPVAFVILLTNVAHGGTAPLTPTAKELTDMICIAFFFLLCLEKYRGTTSDETVIYLYDFHLYIVNNKLNITSWLNYKLKATKRLRLHLTTHKISANKTSSHIDAADTCSATLYEP